MMYEKKAGKALGGYVRSEIVPRRNYNSEKLDISLCYQPSIQAQISILSSKEKNFAPINACSLSKWWGEVGEEDQM